MPRLFFSAAAVWFVFICLSASAHGMDRAELRWIRSKPPIDSIVISGNSFFKASEIKKRMYSRKRSFWKTIKGDRRTRIQRETYPDYVHDPTHGYQMPASPTLYPGQTLHARVSSDERNASCVDVRLFVKAYGQDDELFTAYAPVASLPGGMERLLSWAFSLI